jgi:hypothetical protein
MARKMLRETSKSMQKTLPDASIAMKTVSISRSPDWLKKIRVLPRKSWTGVWDVTMKSSGPEHFTITSPTVYTSVEHHEEWWNCVYRVMRIPKEWPVMV